MIALDQIAPPFSIDVPDVVKMRVVSVIDLADDTPIAMSLVGHDRYRSVQPHALYRLVEKGLGGLCIPSRGQAKIHHLAVGIDGAS